MSRLTFPQPASGLFSGQPSAHAKRARMVSSNASLLELRIVPWLGLGAGVLLGLLVPQFTWALDWLPFLVSLFFLGMPHGAMDWFVQNRLGGVTGIPSQCRAFLPYLLWMCLSIACLVFAPVLTIAAFMVLTIIHFGTADLLATRHGGDSLLRRVLFIAGRGSLVLGPLFAFHPESSWKPFGLLVGMFPVDAAFLSNLSVIGLAVLFIGVVLALVHVVGTGMRDPRSALLDLFESMLILALGCLVAPLFAIGLFFLSTHAYRHSVRLVSEPFEPDFSKSRPALWSRLLVMHLRCIPLLAPTMVILVAWSIIQFGTITPYLLVVVSIGFFIISTLPHHLLGLKLPRYRP